MIGVALPQDLRKPAPIMAARPSAGRAGARDLGGGGRCGAAAGWRRMRPARTASPRVRVSVIVMAMSSRESVRALTVTALLIIQWPSWGPNQCAEP